jgi:iron complex outermembrane receptor protein
MIQWQPGEYSYWVARNIGSVNSSGIESVISMKYEYNDLNIKLNAGYSYTKSVSRKTEIQDNSRKQLMYIPENQANGSIQLAFKNLYAFWIADLTGKRFITTDNTGYLPGYTVNNITCGIKLGHRLTSADLNFRVENLFNVNYQTIAYHPQPGRTFFISILFQINK